MFNKSRILFVVFVVFVIFFASAFLLATRSKAQNSDSPSIPPYPPTATPIATDTDTPTPTDTTTSTPTETFTPTPTETSTSTSTPTDTFTPTSTDTSTPTPTATSTYTAVPSETFTPTSSPTATSTSTSTATATPPGCVPVEGPVLYWNDFEEGAGSEWSNNPTDVSPSGEKFLGQFGNEGTKLAFSCLATHQMVSVDFDLYIIRSWDGNDDVAVKEHKAPDLWSLMESKHILISTTFSNWLGDIQAYPMGYPEGNSPALTGAVKTISLGYDFYQIPMDAIYHMSILFPHDADLLELDFSAMNLQPLDDESWGIDNIQVNIFDLGVRIFLPVIVH
jgi:hypothetical protein